MTATATASSRPPERRHCSRSARIRRNGRTRPASNPRSIRAAYATAGLPPPERRRTAPRTHRPTDRLQEGDTA